MVIAGAGTGKTRVIVERVRHLLATHDDLLPENLLVLTYNVKAAREVRERIQAAIGPATAARLTVANFHSFCVQVLTESASEADLPPHPDVLDGIGQFLLLRDLRDRLNLVYHGPWSFAEFVKFINRAKDELVTPADFDAFVARERQAFEDQYGSYADAAARLATNGNLKPRREVRKEYARFRTDERADGGDFTPVEATADREARRTVSGEGQALRLNRFADEQKKRCVSVVRLRAALPEPGIAVEATVLGSRELAGGPSAPAERRSRRTEHIRYHLLRSGKAVASAAISCPAVSASNCSVWLCFPGKARSREPKVSSWMKRRPRCSKHRQRQSTSVGCSEPARSFARMSLTTWAMSPPVSPLPRGPLGRH